MRNHLRQRVLTSTTTTRPMRMPIRCGAEGCAGNISRRYAVERPALWREFGNCANQQSDLSTWSWTNERCRWHHRGRRSLDKISSGECEITCDNKYYYDVGSDDDGADDDDEDDPVHASAVSRVFSSNRQSACDDRETHSRGFQITLNDSLTP